MRVAASFIGMILGMLPSVVLATDGNLATAKLQKAAVTCQKVIEQAGAKVLADKLKALDACANAALACVQTKHDQPDCLAKAAPGCLKKLTGAATALTKAQAKIVAARSCAVDLRLPDVLSADGLGLGAVAGTCQTELGLDVCAGLDPLAACLLQTRDRAAGVAYGEARPRTAELLALLPTVALPPVAGLPTDPGCGTCGASPETRKVVEQCGKALTKARQGLGTSLEKELASCAEKVLGCVQTKSDTPACLTGATKGCDKGSDKIAGALAKFAAAVAKKCGTSVEFAQLTAPSGLDLAVLVPSCAVAPTNAATLAICLQERAQCTTAELVQQSIARVVSFGEDGHLGALAPALTATCPTALSTLTVDPLLALRAPHALVFGSIIKFLKQIRRPNAGLTGSLVAGGSPTPTTAGRGITRVTAPTRVSFGGVVKIQFHYRFGNALSRAAHNPRTAAPPPSLIVAVRRADVSLDDHFEVVLPVAAPGAEVDDELEVTYQDTIPGCAFELALATKIDGVVSEYTPVLQVVDVPQPTPTSTGPVPTPTPTATAGPITQILDSTGDGAGHTLVDPQDIAADTLGNVYVTGSFTDNVFKIAPGGTVTQIMDATGDGLGHTLDRPYGIAADGLGNVYVTGANSNNAFKIASGGTITEIINVSGDGGGNALSFPTGIAVDGSDNVYVTSDTNRVFKITSGGVITSIIDATGDGSGHTLGTPRGIAVDGTDVYVTGNNTNNAFKITSGSVITQIIDTSGDGAGNTLSGPLGIAVDGLGNAYVAGTSTANLFEIAPGGTVTEILDNSAPHFTITAFDTLADGLGNAYVTGSISAYKIAVGGAITQIIDQTADGVSGHLISGIAAIAMDGAGNLYVIGKNSANAFKIVP